MSARHPQTWRAHLLDIVLVLSAACVVRLVYFAELRESPFFEVPVIDAATYDAAARHLASGAWLGEQGPFWQPPLYPYLLAVVYAAGGNPSVAIALQMVLGVLTAVLVAVLGNVVATRRVGLIAGLAAACYGPTLFFEGRLLPPPSILFLNTAALLLFVFGWDRQRGALTWAAGAVFGLATVARPDAFLVALALAVGLAVARRWRDALLFGLALCLPIVPVTLRNVIVGGDLVWVSANGGLNFYLGNNPNADATLALRPGLEWEELVETPHREAGLTRHSARSRYFYQRGLDFWRAEPLAASANLGRKLVRFASAEEIRRNEDLYQLRRESDLLRLLVWQRPGLAVPFGLVAPLATLGAFLAWRRRCRLWPLYVHVFAYTVAVVLYFVTARYRLPILPVLLVWAAIGIDGLWTVRHEARRLTRWLIVVLAALVLINLNAASPGHDTRWEYYRLLAIAHHEQGDENAAIDAQEKAVAARPETPELHYDLGVYRQAAGDTKGAMAAYRAALEHQPHYAEALVNLALLLARTDSVEAAVRYVITAARIEPDLVPAQVALAGIFLNTGQPDSALAHYDHALALNPHSAAAWAGRAQALLALGATDAAIDSYRQRIRLGGEDASSLHGLGRALKAAERLEEALVTLRRARAMDPDDVPTLVTLGQTYAALGRLDDAEACYTEAIRRDPGRPEPHVNLGDIYARKGLYDLAKGAFYAGLAIDPENFTALYNLAVVETKLGNAGGAEVLLRRLLELDPEHEPAQRALHWLADHAPADSP